MKKYLIALIATPLCFSFNFAQAQSDIKKNIEKEVEVKVDDETGNKVKTIKIKIKDGEGEEKIMEWTGTDESEMSEEMKEHMKEVKVIVIDSKGAKSSSKSIRKEKSVKYRIMEDGDDEHIIEWDGEGEMPQEIKEKLEKEGVMIKKGNVMIYKSDGDSDDNVVIMRQGNKKVKWDSDDDENIFILDDNKNDAKPKLGVMIENHVDGIEIRDVVKGSAAEKGGLKLGDVIFKIDDKYIGSTLQLTSYLDKVTNGKQIKIKVLRDGTEKTLKIDLDKKSK